MLKNTLIFIVGACVGFSFCFEVKEAQIKKASWEKTQEDFKESQERLKNKKDALKRMKGWIEEAKEESDADYKGYMIEKALDEVVMFCR
jgi:hypothetical protein